MWVLTPLFGVFFGFIFLTLVLIGYLWLSKIEAKSTWLTYLLGSLRTVLFSLFVYYAILYLDSIVKILGFGVLGYGNIWFHVTGLILMLLLAVSFLFIAVFNAPTYQTFFTFICILGFCLYFFEFYLPEFSIGERDVLFKTPYIAIAILGGSNIVTLPFRVINYKKRSTLEFKKLWDISEKTKKIINFKSILVLWAFFAVETILQLEGLSILYWIGLL
ncbi:MAG: hypothetical protein ACTSRE_13700 [Promethearchaeota archaeon]